MSNRTDKPILVVDDDRTVRHVLSTTLSSGGFTVETAGSVAECIAQLENSPQLLLLDLNLPDGDGIEVLKHVRAVNDRMPIVLITAEGDSNTAISAARFGACDYLTKPLDLRRLREVVDRALETKTDNSSVGEIVPVGCEDEFIGRSRAMQAVFKSIGRVAKQNVAVLIRGQSGTGKELVARAIWKHSDRSKEIFTAVNCAALSSELLESELFGHEKGAFTGADRKHIGKFEACSSGTLFLDEVGDMHPSMQAKLLRVLQDGTFSRVGGSSVFHTDVRIISATNCDLESMCSRGTFREDLFHRLNGFTVSVPPLRDRDDDLRLLISHFLFCYNKKLHKRIDAIAPDAAAILLQYSWPGNVRELESLLGQLVLNAQGSVIQASDLPSYLSAQPRQSTPTDQLPTESTSADSERNAKHTGEFESLVESLVDSESHDVYAETLEYVERVLLTRILEETDGNQSLAARRLGITRGSLRFKMKQLGISVDSAVKVPSQVGVAGS